MDEKHFEIAQSCLAAAYDGSMDFPTILHTLQDAGFEGYDVDYRRNSCVYFLANGQSIELKMPLSAGAVAPTFNLAEIQAAIREAQNKAAGYTYLGFSTKVKAAGCAGYKVSLLGKRVLYFGRTADVHIEYFPK